MGATAESTATTDLGISTQYDEHYDVGRKLILLKKLRAITSRIHSASNVEQIVSQLSDDICGMFETERLTIYMLATDGLAIVSKVKTGLQPQKDFKLAIDNGSIAGYAARCRK